MVEEEKFVFLTYDHNKQVFELYEHPEKLMDLLKQQEQGLLEEELARLNIDGLLVLDAENEKWYLVFSKNTGIVIQRTARRHADTIVRSGFPHPKGYRIKGEFPLEELSSYNIGDLWQSVQNKYLTSDLKGSENVTSATNPEIIEKKLDTSKDKQKQVRTQTTKRSTKKMKTLPTPSPIPTTVKKTKKTVTKPKENQFVLEIKELIAYVENGNTQLLIQGEPEDKNYPSIVLLKQDQLPKPQFYNALLLKQGNLIMVKGKIENNMLVAESLETASIK